MLKKKNNKNESFTLATHEGNISIPFVYSDTLFSESSANFNVQLARISIRLAYAAFNAPNIFNGSENLETALKVLGFEHFKSNEDYHKVPDTDTIGLGAASKEIQIGRETFTLIYLGHRGGNYQNEWAGNFHVGPSGDHEGFTICKDKSLAFLKEYIERETITGKVKIWSSGFSRGAASCNVLGGHLCKMLDEGLTPFNGAHITLDDLYFYCFETPQSIVLDDDSPRGNIIGSKYAGIHNIINPEDIIPLTGPYAMGFRRYGNDYIIADTNAEDYDERLHKVYSYYKSISNGFNFWLIQNYNNKFKYIKLSPFQKSPTATDFIYDTMDHLSELADYRNGMYKIEDEIMNFFILINSYDKVSTSEMIFFILSQVVKDVDKIAAGIFTANPNKISQSIYELIDKGFEHFNVATYDREKARGFASTFGKYYWNFANKYPEESINFLFNIFSFLAPHDPILVMAWLENTDIPSYEIKI